MHHFAWTATPTVVQISLEGPFDIYYMNPGDHPQRGRDEPLNGLVTPGAQEVER